MQRKMELVRAILLEIEKPEYTGSWFNVSIDGYSEAEVNYHLKLMHDAGLIEAACIPLNTGEIWKPKCVTWQGHEFLDNSRDRTYFEKAKALLVEQGKPLTIEALKLAFSELLKRGFSAF